MTQYLPLICVIIGTGLFDPIESAIDTDQYPSQKMDLNNYYTLEMVQIKIQSIIDKTDEKQNYNNNSPGQQNRKLIKIDGATFKALPGNGNLINATIYLGQRSCDPSSGSGPSAEEVPTFTKLGPCGVKKNGSFQKCWFELWHRPFENFVGETLPPQCTAVTRQSIYGY